jgi:hypothetical protein
MQTVVIGSELWRTAVRSFFPVLSERTEIGYRNDSTPTTATAVFSGRIGSYILSTRHYTLRAFHGGYWIVRRQVRLPRRGTGPPHSLMQIRHTENTQLAYDPSPNWIRAQRPSIPTAESSTRLTFQCQCGHINPLNKKRKLLYLKTQSVPRSKQFSSRL